MYCHDFKHKVFWVTTDLKEEKPFVNSYSFPKIWHCVDVTDFEWKWIDGNQIYIGTWVIPHLLTGRSICGVEWSEQKCVTTSNMFPRNSSLCDDCVQRLLDVDNMSAEQLLGYFYDYLVEYYDGEFGRSFHSDEEQIADAIVNKVNQCVIKVVECGDNDEEDI